MVSLTKRMDPSIIKSEPKRKISKRGRWDEGRPTKRTPEVVARIAKAVATGLTDEEAALLAGINPDSNRMTKGPRVFRGDKEGYGGAVTAAQSVFETGEQGWQGTAWALERIYRFARPEVMNPIAVVQGGKAPERVGAFDHRTQFMKRPRC
jgi:hypothetical protein